MSHTILYEHPLNEQVRTYLRLETLFARQLELQASDSIHDHLSALRNLWQILECLDRGDIKGELLKELDHQRLYFEQLIENPNIDGQKLERFLQQLQHLIQWLSRHQGKFGSRLRADRFLDLVKHRLQIPGGCCSFDLPELHYFLEQPVSVRHDQFAQWFQSLDGLHRCLGILLRLHRENGQFESLVAENGVFQYQCKKSRIPQLIRLRVARDLAAFPEISGSRHCFTIRFLQVDRLDSDKTDTSAYTDDQPFELAIC